MNLPNKLTVARVILIPVFVALFLIESIPYHYAFSLLVFAGAAYTDHLDGKIARERGLVTYFGKMMDPLADKMLVMAAMILFIPVEMAHSVVVIVILAREFLVTSIRLVAMGDGIAIPADGWGKAKTVAQMIWICFGLTMLTAKDSIPIQLPAFVGIIYGVLATVVVILTVVSGFNYTWRNRQLFREL